ncbi:Putative signal peptide peptidase SppA [Legionella massiliensis]|uniref:Putative signal peptide peptidase SppA n=1 Tax=Legionella massiliensis TaxID=1034943 RepID=A0A078L3U6_9GAMM|nr:S49 family peptidase [Legionella massiliensis]CDZ78613.1 Putative signal peptide peptidase SppA [Legionella massiliensis]CEE14351.1 Putative signal peptide peptidase SppA [Legionella massiliensis]
MNNSVNNENPDSQTLLNQIVIEYMREQKRKRRWRWVMRILFLVLILIVAYNIFSYSEDDKSSHSKPHVGLVDVNGSIFDSQSASAENFVKSMDEAYESTGLKAVILRINSPGGSPVQADYMYNAVKYYRDKYPEIKVYAVCVDMCASAAYYLAAAADEIYANPSSMVGSIGVIYNGFGFVDSLQKVGVTRRLQTAGVNKAFLDPFLPENPDQAKILQGMLDDIHNTFIERVKAGRGDRLKIDDSTFSGLFWTGQQAKERGLIDGFASSGQVAREIVKIEEVIDYTYKQSVFERMAKNIGTAIVNQIPVAMGLKRGLSA